MNIFLFVSAIINGITALVAGSITYLKNRSNNTNQSFAVFCFAIAFWAFGSFWPLTIHDHEVSLLSFRILHVGAFFLAITNFHFICNLLGLQDQQKWIIRIGYIIAAILLPLIGTSLFIKDAVAHEDLSIWLQPGIVYHVWIAIWILYFVLAFRLLSISYKKSKDIKQQQIRYIFMGEIVSFSVLIMNFLPAYQLSVPIYFNILLSGQIVAFSYAILRFRYLNVPLSTLGVLKKTIALLVSLGLGLGISYVVFFRQEQVSILLLFPIISLATYFALSGFFNSHGFYKMLGIKHIDDFTKAVDDFYEKKLFYRSRDDLLTSIYQIFVKRLGISKAEVILLDKKNRDHFSVLIGYFKSSHDEYLVLREFLPSNQTEDFNEILKLGSLCLPLHNTKKEVIGFFFLGDKPRQKIYTKQELQILKAATAHISLSLKILSYNADLRQEVDRKTKQLKLSYKKLKILDAEKDNFFSMTSHDLRTPLTIIKGYGDFLLSGKFGKLSKEQTKFVDRIMSSTGNMLWLVNSILDISKLEANRMEFEFEKVELIPLLKIIIEDFQIKCSEKSIQLKFENPNKARPVIQTDPEKLKRVVVNLVGNAFKFTPENGHITVVLDSENTNLWKIEVRDTGVGIPEKFQKLIFEKFRQAHGTSQKGGTGLGLSIVKRIVEKLGGDVRVESNVGQGSRFIFTLPKK